MLDGFLGNSFRNVSLISLLIRFLEQIVGLVNFWRADGPSEWNLCVLFMLYVYEILNALSENHTLHYSAEWTPWPTTSQIDVQFSPWSHELHIFWFAT